MRYGIDYDFGVAYLYTPSEDWEERFYKLAEQCFGIRKSIGYAHLIQVTDKYEIDKIDGEYERLEYGFNLAIWNEQGEKIHS